MDIIHGPHAPIYLWSQGVHLEETARQQLLNMATMPFIFKHIAVMPDVHGATVGSVLATKGAIIPAAVGVDIGCGMLAQRTSLAASDLPDNLSGLRTAIESRIPHGRTHNGLAGDVGAWRDATDESYQRMEGQRAVLLLLCDKHPALTKAAARAPFHVGTLGGGNHFVEVCVDEAQRVWVLLHSGSRGIGNRIGTYFIEKARKEMERWFIHLPDVDLAYLPEGSILFTDYCEAIEWAQTFARINREVMMEAAVAALAESVPKSFIREEAAVNCHHNYVRWERHYGHTVMVTRKGAVSAKHGELGIIPGSMGTKSFIVRGKGNRESFHSCSHGAGRAMSRTEARVRFTVADHGAATKGVECRKDVGVLDETPGAHKDIEAVMAARSELVDIVQTLTQVVCVKG